MESPASADEERISLKSLQKRKIIVTPSELKEPRIIVPEAEQWLHAFSDMTQKVALLTLETETLAEELGKLEKLKMDRQQEIARTQKAELLDDKRKELDYAVRDRERKGIIGIDFESIYFLFLLSEIPF